MMQQIHFIRCGETDMPCTLHGTICCASIEFPMIVIQAYTILLLNQTMLHPFIKNNCTT